MFDVAGKVVVVTGGNKGIGEGIAKGFAKVGCKVSIWGRKEADNQRVRDEILAVGGECVAFQCDVTQEDQINAAVQGTLDAFNGRIDILVNNAGGTTGGRLIWNMSPDQWKKTLDVDMTGPFLCAIALVAPIMRDQRYGRIVNIGSIVGKRITHLSGMQYSAAKAGVQGFNRHLAIELAPYGITVNCVCPGNVETPETSKIWLEQERKDRYKLVHVGRLALPEDIFNACLFFASDEASIINAQALDVDGGSLISWYDGPTYHKLMGEPLPEDVLHMHDIPDAKDGLVYEETVTNSDGNL